MDDYYQFIAPTEEKQGESEGNGVDLFQSWSSSSWGNTFGKLVENVKKQGETLVDVTKRDLTEFVSTVRTDATNTVDAVSHHLSQLTIPSSPTRSTDAPSESTSGPGESSSAPESPTSSKRWSLSILREAPAQVEKYIKEANVEKYLKEAEAYSERLLKEAPQRLRSGQRAAEQMVQRLGSELGGLLNTAVTITAPVEERRRAVAQAKKIIVDRKEAQLAKIRTDASTYTTEPENDAFYRTFVAGFSAQEYTEEISRLLEEHPEVREMMEKLVPEVIKYEDFWKHYFWRVWQVEQEDERRKKLVKDAVEAHGDEEFSWDMDDEEEGVEGKEERNVDKGEVKVVKEEGEENTLLESQEKEVTAEKVKKETSNESREMKAVEPESSQGEVGAAAQTDVGEARPGKKSPRTSEDSFEMIAERSSLDNNRKDQEKEKKEKKEGEADDWSDWE
ncbi:uncharacterized protein VTP21DRAFT_7888 [Calcarisporiella thermophila]|uniref:uncharacterized protein n=1 Tax=Calcarisporiella thermophila TaxID=911321 RepID=UPI003743126B